MTVEPSYTENELRRVGAEYNLSGYLDRVIRRSTPDPRLQAIKDAPRCEHGKIDRHRTAPPEYQWLDEDGVAEAEWCEGATELRALLDARTKEETMSDATTYRLYRNMQTSGLSDGWYGTNVDGMQSDDGVFEFVFIPDDRLQNIADAWNKYCSPKGWVEGIAPTHDLIDALLDRL